MHLLTLRRVEVSVAGVLRFALAGLLVATVLAAGGAASAETGRATMIHYFHAFRAGRISPGVRIVWSGVGYCRDASWEDDRLDAWYCGAKHAPSDLGFYGAVCFSKNAHSRFVICPLAPWSHRAAEIRLTRRLGDWHRLHAALWTKGQYKWAHLPFGVWTTNGKRCRTQTGQQGAYDPAGRVTYVCTDGGVLVGFPHQKMAMWTIRYGRSWSTRHPNRVGITDAWR